MKTSKYLYLISLVLVFGVSSCDQDFEGEIVRDNKPITPVTYEGATTYGFNPYYTVSYSDGLIAITLRIPDNSSLNIKEVSHIVAGATSINVESLMATNLQYLSGPVNVNEQYFTLTTTISEFNSKVPTTDVITAPAAGALVERAFMFRLIMDDNSIIVPVQCRIRITP